MAIRKSNLRRRAEHGPGSVIENEQGRSRDRSPLGRLAAALGFQRSKKTRQELWQVPLPDLLWPAADAGPDPETLVNLLDLAFLGRASAGEIDRELDAMPCGKSEWNAAHFADDLFLAELAHHALAIEPGTRDSVSHLRFVVRVLETVPTDVETVRFRQGILRELEESPALEEAVDSLRSMIHELLKLLRASRDDARLEPLRFRFDILRGFREAVDHMAESFGGSASGLRRLHTVAGEVRETPAYRRLEALLDHDQSMATLDLEAILGADGRLRHLEIRTVRERRKNPFFRRPIRRWWDRLRSVYRRYDLGAGEVAERLVMGVYHEIAPAMARVVQLICHLEVYASTRCFARRAAERGLEVCLPELAPRARLQVEALFNPLLLSIVGQPVPTDVTMESESPVTLVTGPNSGGKTRLLQAIGIAQVLAQSGLYAPCSSGRLPLASGLFASIVEIDRADQAEGRLGTEMVRLRTLFERVPHGAVVLLDELCSGTNPSEAIEIVDVVLRLLRQLEPSAFVTTHFLDFADRLQKTPTIDDLDFLQAEIDHEHGPTYRFVRGVATTSLAAGTARRLGVTFEELEKTLQRRIDDNNSSASQEIGHLPDGDQRE